MLDPKLVYEQAFGLLHEESGVAFDRRCVAALERVLARERATELAVAI
jgi:hypothetical protein